MDTYRREFSNTNVQKYLGGVVILESEKDENNWLYNINKRLLEQKKVFTWNITLKEQSNISVGRIDLGGFQNKKAADISYYIWEKYWGKGYAPEAIMRVTDFGFAELELARIQAIIDLRNSSSIMAIEKAGFRKEGVLKSYPIGKSIEDVYMYAKVKE